MGLVKASSERALKVFLGGFACFHQNGINPQRAATNSVPPLSLGRSMGIKAVGETLNRWASGLRRRDSGIAQKRSISVCVG